MVSGSTRTEKITNFFGKIAEGILVGLLIAGILLAISSPGWVPATSGFPSKTFSPVSKHLVDCYRGSSWSGSHILLHCPVAVKGSGEREV